MAAGDAEPTSLIPHTDVPRKAGPMLCFAPTPRTLPMAHGHPPSILAACWMPSDDELLALLLTTWALSTGRIPPARSLDQLTDDELIDFWADEQTATGSGRPSGSWGR
ncbi:hypothetical protein [Planotetraspora sp. GP83]|uniref:hypothetical protein n=1 Tax=Planotetraspora sp. GP83 TaxID=3156264 RepID=UPI003516E369